MAGVNAASASHERAEVSVSFDPALVTRAGHRGQIGVRGFAMNHA
jgi:hypothetical protein